MDHCRRAGGDPNAAADPTSAELVENLFLSLTRYDPEAGAVVPELAREWTISDDAQTFTFTLRDDVFWVHYDPASHVTARVRRVAAQDFVDGIRRACVAGSVQSTAALLASAIEGCDAVGRMAREAVTPDALAQVRASAPAPDTLVIQTRAPAAWFLSVTPTLRPVPLDEIRRRGDGWTLPGNLVSTGPFVLSAYEPNHRVELLRANGHLPADLNGPGNVERVIFTIVRDANAGYASYLEHKVDVSRLPPAEEAAFLFAGLRPPEAALIPELRVGYIGFAHDKVPFNDARVRRAFAAAIDRAAFVDQALSGVGIPLTHLAPPGVFGAPDLDAETDLGYDPEYAREQLAAAGYPECFGFPVVTILAYDSAAVWVDFALRSWEEVLGCEAQAFTVQLARFPELLDRTDPATVSSRRPHLFTLAWLGDYPDEHNWVGDLLWCEAEPRTRRLCSAADDLIAQAAVEVDTAARRDLYAQIERDFFGARGETPLIPLYQRVTWLSVKRWVSGPLAADAAFGGVRWDRVNIDYGLQQRCRSKGAGPDECTIPFVLPSPAPTATPTATPTSAVLPTLARTRTLTATPALTQTPTVMSLPASPTRTPSATPAATQTPTVISVPVSPTRTPTNAPTVTPTVFSLPAQAGAG